MVLLTRVARPKERENLKGGYLRQAVSRPNFSTEIEEARLAESSDPDSDPDLVT
jgi:hypothetical protein